ncbi:hypothetical protein PSHT_15245 [Puccinia striiformis]|uniref:Uncharacterized protein n=2 Tax=Puccinia striiformis TaxID=27350 RepID=A0A0L0VYW9_9BASI|nr:hypothetical protein PSTG_02371 [Puccinia striiformis f. sp. tritici PST-78]POV96219.1 hypothetical protein PSHT_15245 [Puccinia striiformis]
MKLMIPILSYASALVLFFSKATASHVKKCPDEYRFGVCYIESSKTYGSPLEGKCEPGVFKCCHNDLASNPHARGGCQ